MFHFSVKPVVKAIVTPVKVVKGKDATIKCEATGNPSPVITWQKKNKDKFVDVPGQVVSLILYLSPLSSL